MRLILDELRYNSPDVRSDAYHPGPTDVQPPGCTIPIIDLGVLSCAILDKLISSLPDTSSRWWINLTRQPDEWDPEPADV